MHFFDESAPKINRFATIEHQYSSITVHDQNSIFTQLRLVLQVISDEKQAT